MLREPEDTSSRDARPPGLHWLLWLGLPAAGLLVVWLTPLLGRDLWGHLILHEIGILEIATVAFLLPAIVLGFVLFLRRRRLPKRVGWLMLLMALGSLYFAGEECSWGQTYLHFATPKGWAEVNRQREFNLHNLELKAYGEGADVLEDFLNQIPRAMLLVAILVGGVILPLTVGRKIHAPEKRRSFWYWAVPTGQLVFVATVAAMSTLPEKLYKIFLKPHHPLPPDSYAFMAFIDPAGEFKEFAFALAILLYVLSVYVRARKLAFAAPAKAAQAAGNYVSEPQPAAARASAK